MNICQVVAGDIKQIGGLEGHVLALSGGLASDHRVTLVAHPAIERHLPEGVVFVPLDLSRGRFNLFNLFALRKLIKNNQFDIVHAHANKACFVLALLKSVCRFNLVATLHGQKKKLWAFSCADHVISVSKRISMNVKNSNQTVIYNGVTVHPEKQSLRELCGIDDEDFLFCTVGRMEKVKGFDLLIRAFVAVPGKLIIIGDGTERKNLEQLISDNNLQNKVFCLGFIDNASGLLGQADTVVISSRREGFSYVFAEALLSMTPVVSTDVADISSILGSKYVVPVGDIEALSAKMKYIVEHIDSVREDFAPFFDFARVELHFSAMLNKTCDVYQTLVR